MRIMIKYVAGRVAPDLALTDSTVFDTWVEARQHLELLAQRPGQQEATKTIRALAEWTEPRFGSVREASDTRLFLYPVVADGHGAIPRLACPRCRGEIEATELRHGDVVGPHLERIAFVQTMTTGYRVYCQGSCDSESEECTRLLDALDGFMWLVAWPPRDQLRKIGGTAVPRDRGDYSATVEGP